MRTAVPEDLDQIKAIADANRLWLGFVLRPALLENIRRDWVLVADRGDEVIGFVSFHYRRDGWTTLYEICVAEGERGNGAGRAMLDCLVETCRMYGSRGIRLKCVVGNPANGFFEQYGFRLVGQETGKRRPLNVWQFSLRPWESLF